MGCAVVWDFQNCQHHLMFKKLNMRPYMVTKRRCVWNKTQHRLAGAIVSVFLGNTIVTSDSSLSASFIDKFLHVVIGMQIVAKELQHSESLLRFHSQWIRNWAFPKWIRNSVNSANSENLINHRSMNWAKCKALLCYLCLLHLSLLHRRRQVREL